VKNIWLSLSYAINVKCPMEAECVGVARFTIQRGIYEMPVEPGKGEMK